MAVSPGKTDTDNSQESPSKHEKSEIHDMMVSSFGSEKQKRVYAAAKRNKVEAGTLESALATAVSHMEGEGSHDRGGRTLLCLVVAPCQPLPPSPPHFSRSPVNAKFRDFAPSQPHSREAPRCVQYQ